MKKYSGVLLGFLIFAIFIFSPTQFVSASATTETVSYQVNKAGTDQPSLSNGFFSGIATLNRPDDGPATVTLHLIKYASTIKSFSIGDQVAKITNTTDDTADLTFELDDSFQLPVVQAAMSVMNMNQKADLVFAKALYQPELSTATVSDPSVADSDATADDKPSNAVSTDESASTQTTSPAEPLDQSVAATSTNVDSTTSSDKSDSVKAAAGSETVLDDSTTETVSYQVNKAGTDTPSLSNGFFTGQAVVTIKDARAETVTLHLQQYASMIKSFSIGDQPAKIANVTGDTADLTFTVDDQFAKPIVQANMSVMNMNQKADLVFAKALYQADETNDQSEISTPIQSTSATDTPITTDTSATDPVTDTNTPSTDPESATQVQPSSKTDVPKTSATDQTTATNAPATKSEDSTQAPSAETDQPATTDTPVTDQTIDTDAPTSKPEESAQKKSSPEVEVPVTTQNSGTDQIADTMTSTTNAESTASSQTSTASKASQTPTESASVEAVDQSQVDDEAKTADQPTSTPANNEQSTPTATNSQTVAYHVNKVGTDTPSISNSFFTGQATITTKAGQPDTVTLHIQQHASAIERFSIGTQQAKMTNVTADTADLTFNIDQSFAKPVVTASMSVMGMDQQADLVFAQALYHSEPTVTKPAETQTPSAADQSTKPTTTKSATTETPTADNIVAHQATTSEVKTQNQSQVTTPKTDTTTTSTKPVVSNQSPATPATEIVKYHVNKAGTNMPSIANDFFTGEATVTLQAGQAQTVTLHLQKYASTINSFSIGDQNAKITNVNGDTGDLTFNIDGNFAKPLVQANISVMNMNQKADIVFDKALAQATTQTSETKTPETTVAEQTQPVDPTQSTTTAQNVDTNSAVNATKPAKQADASSEPTTTSRPSQNASSKSDIQTQTVAYHVNKTGTNTPSLANDFFTGQATITSQAGQPQTVTLHLQKYASTINSFAIGTQNAKITNVSGETADLTFIIDASFAKPIVQASMSVMSMNQTADLVFAKALYQVNSTEAPVTTPSSQPKSVQVATSKPSAVVKPQTQITTSAQQAGEVSAKLYQAQNGQLTNNRSAAQQFISQFAKVVRHATSTTVTLHTTGAEYIQAMRVAGQLGRITNRHGANADLVFTLSNQALSYALPVSFSLVVPGAGAMTQSAFLLLDLPVQAAKVDPDAKPLTTTSTSTAGVRPVVASATAHAIDANLTQQAIPYTVLDAGGSALSTANQYFTHSARVVKAGLGYDVYLTVRVAAGIVNFTPISINGGAVSDLTHAVIGGQDVWTFRFHVANANSLDQLIPATILMSVPMANISNQRFNIEFAFARLAQNNVAMVSTPAASQASKTKALKAITIKKKMVKAAGKATSTTQAASKGLDAQQRLATLKHYPIGWEALAFILMDGLILLGAWFIRRRRVKEVAHD